MSTRKRIELREIMTMAWSFVKRNGFSLSEALKVAWINAKLRSELHRRIVKFYFQKVNGEIGEAYGTMASNLIPKVAGVDNRKRNESVQVYSDTEVQEWRCFKVANLIKIA